MNNGGVAKCGFRRFCIKQPAAQRQCRNFIHIIEGNPFVKGVSLKLLSENFKY